MIKHPFVYDDMTEGYLQGLSSSATNLPDCFKAKSVAFRHGWLNGRDDRLGKPRDDADVLRRRASMIDSARR